MKILPLSLYIEFHDILFMWWLKTATTKSEPDDYHKSDKATLESKITSKQWKLFSKVRRNFLEPGCTTAEQISKVGETWNYSTNESSQRFTPNFPKTSCNKTESCSWRLLCFCGSCNPYEKLVLFVNWRGLRPLDNKSIVLSYYYILFGSQMALCSRAIQSSSIGSLFSSFQSESTALLFSQSCRNINIQFSWLKLTL